MIVSTRILPPLGRCRTYLQAGDEVCCLEKRELADLVDNAGDLGVCGSFSFSRVVSSRHRSDTNGLNLRGRGPKLASASPRGIPTGHGHD